MASAFANGPAAPAASAPQAGAQTASKTPANTKTPVQLADSTPKGQLKDPYSDKDAAVVAAGKQLMQRMKMQSLVITRGRDGMVAFDRQHKPVDIPISGSDQAADVTGAGDTVIAAFTAALAAGATTEEAAQLANYAGGIVVMKRGTATVSREELLHAIEQSPPATRPH